jgi:ATP-dependent exoDNAse (exonuclease V) beta subunit
MNRPADWQQRQLGRDLSNSYIVQAPAGSGKTELLTQRMLGLLAHVENPEEVVAITFTRKAAAEMNHRLVGRLQAAAKHLTAPDETETLAEHEQLSRDLAVAVLENDAVKGWNLLEQPSRLRIRTIDSLCSELARQLPVLSGLGGGQQIAVDADALYRSAAMQTLAVIEDARDPLQSDVIRILDRYDNQYDRLLELLTGMLASREQWMPHLMRSRTEDGFDRQGMEESLCVLVEIELQNARRLTPVNLLRELPRFYRYAISNNADNTDELTDLLNISGGVDCVAIDLPATAEALPHWKTMLGMLLTKAGGIRKSAPATKAGFPAPSTASGEEKERRGRIKEDFKTLLESCAEDIALLELFNTIQSLPSPGYPDEAWESLESLMRILLRAAKNWIVVMAESGEMDFGEITNRAIEALGSGDAPSDLALRLDYRIQHLLVDEFQDTSHSQIRLLDKLTAGWVDGDGRTLFLVGDPMQSIYRFRKAEVSLFIKAWQGELFDHIQPMPLQLSVNFRSTKPVVDWVNQTFPVVMPSQDDPVMGAVSYSRAQTRPEAPGDGSVSIQILAERDDEQEADHVIAAIRQSEARETTAILVRSRAHARTILSKLDSLKQENTRFRYQAVNFTRLADTSLIKDLVSLTLALTQPADRLAWLSVLRAPFAGLDLADLDALVAGDAGNIILDAIQLQPEHDERVMLSEDGRQRLRRIGPVLSRAVRRRGRQSIRSLVESTWTMLGGPACVSNSSELADAATFLDLLESLENERLSIDRDTLDLRLQNLYTEPDALADGNLQVLTIYSAKGLQFDNVILPGLNLLTSGDNGKLLHWFELADENKFVLSPMRNNKEKEQQKSSADLIQFISGIEKQRQRFEDSRLLYVASTRAISKLHLFGAIKPSQKGAIKPSKNSLLGSLWPAIEAQQTALIQQAAETLLSDEAAPGESTAPEPVLAPLPQVYRRLDPAWCLPEPPGSVQLPDTPADQAHDYIEFSWAGEDARLAGNLVHRLLQTIGEQGLDKWASHGLLPRHFSWCYQYLASEGVKEAKAEAIVLHASRAIENCLASDQGRWILDRHEDAHCEYKITAVVDKQLRNLVLDRTFVDMGTRWIIDYKTSSHTGGDLLGFLDNEASRYREQLLRYKAAMAMNESRPIKTALYFPLLDRLKEID